MLTYIAIQDEAKDKVVALLENGQFEYHVLDGNVIQQVREESGRIAEANKALTERNVLLATERDQALASQERSERALKAVAEGSQMVREQLVEVRKDREKMQSVYEAAARHGDDQINGLVKGLQAATSLLAERPL